MTLPESIELKEIRKKLSKHHATREDVQRARDILASNDRLLARFEQQVKSVSVAKAGSDKTAAERQRRHREKDSAVAVGEWQIDYARREGCRMDLVKFGCTYCRNMLNHDPSAMMVNALIRPLQNSIIYGGLNVVQFPRGTGKTTWMKIAMIWAVLYGYKQFVMTIAATRALAKAINDQLVATFEGSAMLKADFPAIVDPIVAIEGNWRKASTQKYEGRPTRIVNSEGYFVLPTVYRDGTDEPVEVAAGAIFYTAGIHGAIRGIAREKRRPDMIFFDDPQTRDEAESLKSSDKLERLIEGDALGNYGQTGVRSCIMAITPISVDDIASRFSSRDLHPTWGSSKQQYIIRKSAKYDDLFPAYREAYAEDVAAQKAVLDAGGEIVAETAWQISTRFYNEHRADFAGTEVIDPLNFNSYEVDGVHHILNVQSAYRDQSLFDAEMQMAVRLDAESEPLKPEEVENNLNGFGQYVLPPGTVDAVAFCDVNIAHGSGLRWGVLAVGPNRVTSVIAYGAYPENGRELVPPNTPPVEIGDYIFRAIVEVTRRVLTLPFTISDTGERVIPKALAFDAGYQPDAVHKAVKWIGQNVKLYGMDVLCTLGRNWKQFKQVKKGDAEMVSKDHVYSAVTRKSVNGRIITRKYVCMHADYWREIAQMSFRRPPLSSGSCSLFGKRSSVHREFALEVTYEQLIGTTIEKDRRAWEWRNVARGQNHYGDVLYGCFAMACWKDLYFAVSKPSLTAPHVMASGKRDWFKGSAPPVKLPPHSPKMPVKLFRGISRPRFVR